MNELSADPRVDAMRIMVSAANEANQKRVAIMCDVIDVLLTIPSNEAQLSLLSQSGRDVLERYAEMRLTDE